MKDTEDSFLLLLGQLLDEVVGEDELLALGLEEVDDLGWGRR